MLEVTILKVAHGNTPSTSGEQEARKLIPFVQECNIFGMEFSYMTEKDARAIEMFWTGLLGISRSCANEEIAAWQSRAENGGRFPDGGYIAAEFDHLHCNGVPLFIPERWPYGTDVRETCKQYLRGISLYEEGIHSLSSGNAKGGIRLAYEGVVLCVRSNERRDAHMAEVIRSAEENIRSFYPDLSEDPLKYCVALGAAHRVEDLLERDPLVVSLLPKSMNPVFELVNKVRDGASCEEVAQLISYIAHQESGASEASKILPADCSREIPSTT